MNGLDPQFRGRGLSAALGRLPTGAKVFLILVGALLPLALIALFTTLQTTRSADDEARERLSVTAQESAGNLENLLANHVAQLGEALAALERDPQDAPGCTRLAGTYAAQAQARFLVRDGRGHLLCGSSFEQAGLAKAPRGDVAARIVPGGLVLRISGDAGATAIAYYPHDLLAGLARPSGFVPEYGAALIAHGDRLTLRALKDGGPLDRGKSLRSNLGIDDLALETTMPGAPITSPLVIATVLLVLMWIAAAGIGWFVVNILLIRPLQRLRSSVANYQPGDVIDTARLGPIPAQEIRELGDTFSQISRTVQEHEADLAKGLVQQTRLTREVHHRVKNNLQVISSLINFHARAAKGDEAAEAYASIQRRVDALAVVHRHHYAEMEVNRGLELRSVIGELAANLRATAPERARGIAITLEVEPVLVTQDVAIAVAFLLTEIVELAITCNESAQVRISIKAQEDDTRALVRVNSPALISSPLFEGLVEKRYGRVLQGLARQLRTQLHHDPLVGAYETSIPINGRP
ncbi:sensor histidine kinase [Sphingomonas azotifigens]|uniref:sensor histidine kinase n=1 Tax=Sphingomonas azotifigens TaxID=330920 RepID=UPI000A06DD68|nr:sensor histidine kinase [Sphingomonas azotifigens]